MLRLQDALARALASNKNLVAFEHRFQEQKGHREQAGLLSNPEIDLEIENGAGSGRFEGLDSAETTLSLGWVLEERVRMGRVNVAEASAEVLSAEARILRVEVAADTAEHFLESLASQARLARAQEAVALAEQTVEAVARRVRAGRIPTAEFARARAELATARLARDDFTHERSAAYHRLAAQWGETEPDFSAVQGDLLSLPAVEPYAVLEERLNQNPELARLATQERLAVASRRLAEARRWPALRPRVGIRRLEATNDTAFVAGISLLLPLVDRNQGEIDASRARVSRARAEAETARVRLRTTLFELYEELKHHFHRAHTLRVEVIPRLMEALDGTLRAYERGRYGYLELRSVQTELLRAHDELLDASSGAHRLVIALERLVGEPVVQKGGRR